MNSVSQIRGISAASVAQLSQIQVNPLINVMVVSDCEITLAGLKSILQKTRRVDVTSECESLDDAPAMCGKDKPDIVVFSVSNSREAILRTAEKIIEVSKSTRMIVLNKNWSVNQISECVGRGILGFITPPNPANCLGIALESVARGCLWIGPNLMVSTDASTNSGSVFGGIDTAGGAAVRAKLSQREAEIADLVAQGLSNRGIAQVLVITVDTVKSHLHHIMTKLEVRDRTQIAMKLLNVSQDLAADTNTQNLAELPTNVRLRAS